MINTEHGRLDELIEMLVADRLHVAEALGVGPSGMKSADRTLLGDDQRHKKFRRRLDNLTQVIEILRAGL